MTFKSSLLLKEQINFCSMKPSKFLTRYSTFESRHIGTLEKASEMLQYLGFQNINDFINEVIPKTLALPKQETLSEFSNRPQLVLNESELFNSLKIDYANLNKHKFKSFLGDGYSNVIQPSVINRIFLNDPSFYTSYTPYQAEISQGRLELLINFQTLVMELTGLDLANSSLLDEPSACVEAIMACYNFFNGKRGLVLIDKGLNNASVQCIRTRLGLIKGIQFQTVDLISYNFEDVISSNLCCTLMQYPNKDGLVTDYTNIVEKTHKLGGKAIVSSDLMALTILKNSRSFGFDIAIGSTQRFGVEMGFGGPYAAYLACNIEFKRKIPGRIVGVSKDISNNPNCYRLALQTREQHIKRQRATSNICTAQALLANLSALYAIYHGPEGLKRIASRIHKLASCLYNILSSKYKIIYHSFFDTILIQTNNATNIINKALENKMNFKHIAPDKIRISIDEATTIKDIENIAFVFGFENINLRDAYDNMQTLNNIPKELQRKDDYMRQKVFNLYHTETDFMRYVQHIKSKDVSLTDCMIPLGSCTMKLNASIQMQTLSIMEFVKIHPSVPYCQALGYQKIIKELESDLAFITGMAKCTIHPISGAQGEYLALTMIKKYYSSKNETDREYCLIPSSAHGTNAASASMTQYKIININCSRSDGILDLNDLKKKISLYNQKIALMMITYPSTYGIFESNIREVIDLVHSVGAQVYLDGANMNAQIGLISPGSIGADICHLNLHKTFCIPHGGGGPGVGPVCVKKHLEHLLPNFDSNKDESNTSSTGQVNGFKYGSASILLISWMYIKLMGFKGLMRASQHALLNANYLAKKLSKHYKILFCDYNKSSEQNKYCAHEFIIDLSEFKKFNIYPVDVCKRLLDYNFHSPTMSWPITEGIMIEPTESESKMELDRFASALISIRNEIQEVMNDFSHLKNQNVLNNAPHDLKIVTSTNWPYKYSREKAAYPLKYLYERKKWPLTRRIDDAYGDLNLNCSCPNPQDLVDVD